MRISTWHRFASTCSHIARLRPNKVGLAFFIPVLCSIAVLAVSIRLLASSSGLLVARQSNLIWKGPATRGVGADAPANARFELNNVGGTPVRIISVTSGCGCAKPVVRPELVAPGAVAVVEVTALTIPVGEKDVLITVHTDSPVNPDVPLTLKLVGTRKPPFLYLIDGEAVFLGEYSPAMSREIGVYTIESGEQGTSPRVDLDLPFLKATLTGVETKPYIEPGTLLRRWKYRVELKDRPSSGSFTGLLTAKSPWDPDDSLSLNVVGQLRSGPRAFPSAIILDRSGGASASLLVVCEKSSALDVATAGPPAIPFFVKEEGGAGERKVHRFTVGLQKPLASDDSAVQTRIRIRQHGSEDELDVPVRLMSKDDDSEHKQQLRL